jgi:hypothetical protein
MCVGGIDGVDAVYEVYDVTYTTNSPFINLINFINFINLINFINFINLINFNLPHYPFFEGDLAARLQFYEVGACGKFGGVDEIIGRASGDLTFKNGPDFLT